MQALERRSLPLVLLLKERYAPVLERDPSFGALLHKIEQLHLDAHSSGGGLGGMLGGLFKNMAGGGGGVYDEIAEAEEGEGGLEEEDAEVTEAQGIQL